MKKKKSLLALGAVSLVGLTATVVLPITLTSCSDENKNNQPIAPNPDIQVSINQSNENSLITLTASVSVKNNNNDNSGTNKSGFGYQWYYKEKSAANFLDFNPDIVKGFTSITNATKSTLTINSNTYPNDKLEKYEFTCVAYELMNPENYGLAIPISISTETSNPPSGDSQPQQPGEHGNGESNNNSGSVDHDQPNDSKPEVDNNGTGSTDGNHNQSDEPKPENQSKVKYINIDFQKLTHNNIKIYDTDLEKIFNAYKNKDVTVWSGNYLYKDIAKVIDSNYETNNSLMGWMVCKNVRQNNGNWKTEVYVFANTDAGYWFKNNNTVSRTISFTQSVEFMRVY